MDSGVAMPTIDLLRHGDTGHRGFRGQLDDVLSACGWAQTRAATQDGHWDAIVSSPLRRCAAFAHELATQRGLPLQLDPRLSEYHFGHWQDLPLETIADVQGEALASFWADPEAHPPPGAEPLVEFAARVAQAIDDIVQQQQRARVLVVAHGGVIRLLRCLEQRREFRAMSEFEVPHASLHRLQWLGAEDRGSHGRAA